MSPSRFMVKAKDRCLAQIDLKERKVPGIPSTEQCKFKAVNGGPYCARHSKQAQEYTLQNPASS